MAAPRLALDTLCVTGDSHGGRVHGAAVFPIFQTATFVNTGE
jgi:hypothetical protein